MSRGASGSTKRRYPRRPVLGVGALIFDRGRILLVERARSPLKGCWSLPGGVLEAGETLKEGIRREVREETGLEVEPVGIFEVFERIMADRQGRPEYHYVLIDFLCRIAGGRLVPGDDVRRAAWVLKSELDHYNITEGTRAVIERAFRRRRALLKL